MLGVLVSMHFVADAIVRIAVPRKPKNTRWLLVHAFGNVYCAFMAFLQLWTPTNSYADPFIFAVWIHIYHTLLYPLSTSDLLHHTVFVPLLCVPGVLWNWGRAAPLQLIFINGLPGALLYFVVASGRFRAQSWSWEPRVTFFTNAFLRLPGILYANYVLFHEVPYAVPRVFVLIQFIMAPFNGLYYSFEAYRRMKRMSL